MSPEIHGALVGGALGAVFVLVGITLDSWATGVRERRAAVEAAAFELTILLPHVVGPISAAWSSDQAVDTSYGSEWSRRRDEVQSLLFSIIQNTRWPMRKRERLLNATFETQARLAAYWLLWFKQRSQITTEEAYDLYAGAPGAVLSRAKLLDDRVDYYDAKARADRGFGTPPPLQREPRVWVVRRALRRVWWEMNP